MHNGQLDGLDFPPEFFTEDYDSIFTSLTSIVPNDGNKPIPMPAVLEQSPAQTDEHKRKRNQDETSEESLPKKRGPYKCKATKIEELEREIERLKQENAALRQATQANTSSEPTVSAPKRKRAPATTEMEEMEERICARVTATVGLELTHQREEVERNITKRIGDVMGLFHRLRDYCFWQDTRRSEPSAPSTSPTPSRFSMQPHLFAPSPILFAEPLHRRIIGSPNDPSTTNRR